VTSDATASEPVKPGAGASGSAGSTTAETTPVDSGAVDAEPAGKASAGSSRNVSTGSTGKVSTRSTRRASGGSRREASAGATAKTGKASAEAVDTPDVDAQPGSADSAADTVSANLSTEHPVALATAAADSDTPATEVPDSIDTSDSTEAADPTDASDASEVADSTEASDSAEASGNSRAVPAKPRSNQLVIDRPPEMVLGAIFLTLAALPLVLAGLGLMLQLGQIGPNLARTVPRKWPTVDVEVVVLLVRVAGFVLLLIGLLFIALTWFACKPRRWARAGATALAAVEALLLIAAMIMTAVDPVSLGLILLAGAGAVLLYLPRSEEFLLAQR
jgi:hypothetical protein